MMALDPGRPRILGIAGGTGAGKGALVEGLCRWHGATAVLDLDSYYVDRAGMPAEARAHLNFDEPAAIEIGLLIEHVASLAAGRRVDKPGYSFASHTRIGASPVAPAPLVVVEGLFTLWWPELRSQFDVAVYVDAPADVRLARRLRRDVRDRGRDVESVLTQWVATVRPMHERYVEPTRAFADLVIANDGELEPGILTLCGAAGTPRLAAPPG
jgi:uridine kinase